MYTPIKINRNSWYGSNYWESYSNKIKRTVRFFSDLEYENWILIETNPKVKTFCEQPLKISCLYEGKKVESILDMWVYYYDGYEEFIEVKYANELNPNNAKSERSIRQTNIQRYWCKENNKNYRILTEKEIRSNRTYLNNLKQLLCFVKNQERSIKKEAINHILENISNKPIKIINLINNITIIPNELTLKIIYLLIVENRIFSTIKNQILSYETEVWKNE